MKVVYFGRAGGGDPKRTLFSYVENMWSEAVREGRGVPGDPSFEGDLWVVRRVCMLNGCLVRPHHM